MIIDKISQSDKVLILGFAREGQSTYKYLRAKFPELIIGLADQKTPDWLPDDPLIHIQFGENYLKIENWKLVIKSPGISPHKPELVAAKKRGAVFTSHTEIFFEVCPSKNTIGITGTKGKSTTTSLIYEVIKKSSLPVVLVGNIGRPALDFLPEITPDTWVVLELSSYQLMDLQTSPHIAVLQAIYSDHLDYHTGFEEYKNAKYNITNFQSAKDYLITQTDIPTLAKKIIFSFNDFGPATKTKLLGKHNRLNIIPALKVAEILNLPKDKLYAAVKEFTPLDTRLQPVGTKKGIEFYSDTLATIPEATIAAIDALHPKVTTLIAGGHDRKQNYSELAKKILSSGIKTLIAFPATGPRIWSEIISVKQNPNIGYYYTESMQDAVKLALDHAASGEICLLSPAAPSFTLFKDYRDEAEQYIKFITGSTIAG